MFLQRGVLQPRKEAAVNFGCPPVYHVGLRTDGTDFWSRKKKNAIMDIKEYSTDIWDIIVDHFAETKYQMMCIRWCARGLALGDAIKKVQVDMEVAENCLANKKRNM